MSVPPLLFHWGLLLESVFLPFSCLSVAFLLPSSLWPLLNIQSHCLCLARCFCLLARGEREALRSTTKQETREETSVQIQTEKCREVEKLLCTWRWAHVVVGAAVHTFLSVGPLDEARTVVFIL